MSKKPYVPKEERRLAGLLECYLRCSPEGHAALADGYLIHVVPKRRRKKIWVTR